MTKYHITGEQLEKAEMFFEESSVDVLTDISIRINTEQPNFTAVLLQLEMFGLIQPDVEDLLESVFVVYYAQTVLNRKSIPAISLEEIMENVDRFAQFITNFNQEKAAHSPDLNQNEFLRDEIVLHYALEKLNYLFGDYRNIPNEVTFTYFGLLKGIELGAEKAAH